MFISEKINCNGVQLVSQARPSPPTVIWVYNIVFSASRINPESVISSVFNSSLSVSPSESLSSFLYDGPL